MMRNLLVIHIAKFLIFSQKNPTIFGSLENNYRKLKKWSEWHKVGQVKDQ